jgi:hypothetical protein
MLIDRLHPLRRDPARGFFAALTCMAAVVLMLTATPVMGQSESGRAALVGRVTDGLGGAIPGATIVVTAAQTHLSRRLQSDQAGLYSFPSLPVGTYTLKATANGFGDSTIDNLMLSVGQTAEINVALKPGAVSTSVTVTDEDTDITHRTETDNASVLNNRAVENLPTRGRNFTDFALLTPGITQEGDRFGLIVNGQRSGNSNISIDGVDFNDPLQNGQRGGSEAVYFFPQVAVREFQVVRTGLSAEIGRTNAGFVNVVTKSGTNRFHGEALYANRNPWLTWPDALNDPEASNNENQYAFGIGGPILHDKLFFFAGVEKTNFQVPFFVRLNANCPTAGYYDPTGLSPLCAKGVTGTGPLPLPAFITSQEINSYGVNNPLASSARLDWQIDSSNTVLLQYMSTFLSGLAFGASGVQDATASSNTTYAQQSQAVVLGLTTALASNRTNDLRTQWVYDNRQQLPNSPGTAEVDIGDLGTVGGTANGPYLYRAIREELIDNYSWLVGKNSFRFGIDINIEPETQQREDNANGLWTVDTFIDYLAALPVAQGGSGMTPSQINLTTPGAFRFQQLLPATGTAESKYRATQREFAGYIQDAFHIVPRLTLNLGFRYDAQLEPSPVANPALSGTGLDPSDITMFQPRFGLAWDIRGDGRTVLRASTGLFDARTPGYILARDFTDNGLYNAQVDSNYDPSLLNKLPVYGSFATLPVATVLNDIYVTNPAFRNPRSLQVATTLEQAITNRLALVIGFTQQETWKLQHRLNTNLFQPTIDQATFYPVFPTINPVTNVSCSFSGAIVPCRPNNSIAGFHQNFSTAHATYRSLTAQLTGNFTRQLTGAVNFTWATSRDDDSNERDFDRELALDSLCVACYNRGYSKQDIRDNFNIHFVYRLPLRFTFSSSFITRTALPYSAVTSGSKQGDFNNDGNTANDRPILCSQVPFTMCPVGGTQINAYKGGAEVGTVVGRNTFREDGFINWDMRMIKAFRIVEGQEIQFSAECLNCTRSSNLNLGANQVSKFTHAQSTLNPVTGYYYSGNSAGLMIDAYDTFRSGGPRQIQLGARYYF